MRDTSVINEKWIWSNGNVSLEEYINLVSDVEIKLDEAYKMVEKTKETLNHEDVFRNVWSAAHGK